MRQSLVPTFKLEKVRNMSSAVACFGLHFQNYIDSIIETSNTKPKSMMLDIREMMTYFTADVTFSTIFGVNSNCVNNPDSSFRKIITMHMNSSRLAVFKSILSLSPKLCNWLKISFLPNGSEDFFDNLAKEILDSRENKKIVRRDLMQQLVQIRNSGQINDDDNLYTPIVDGI